jgi:hypothetical protein
MKPMLPKEHGAWGMVLLPALAGLAVAGVGSGAGWLALVMVFFAYVSRAPIEAVAKGRRGPETWRWLLLYLGIAGLCAAGLAFGLLRTAWLTAAVWALPVALLTVLFAAAKRNRDVVNELAGAVALPIGGAVTYAAAANQSDATALGLWLSFALYNALSVPYVRTWVMARRAQKNEAYRAEEQAARRWAWWGLAATIALVAGQIWHGCGSAWLAVGWVPAWVRVPLGLRLAGQRDVPIKTLGWIEMACATGFAAVVAIVYRVALP